MVEDNADVTDAMRVLFEHHGYRVSSAATVAAAVRVGLEDAPQIVLLDLSLGHEDGLDILAQWSERDLPRPHVLALTGHADPETRERCIDAGCQSVLLKPVPTAELVSRVRALT